MGCPDQAFSSIQYQLFNQLVNVPIRSCPHIATAQGHYDGTFRKSATGFLNIFNQSGERSKAFCAAEK